VYGIYTLYQTGKLSKEPLPSIREVEEMIESRVHGNEVSPHLLRSPLIPLAPPPCLYRPQVLPSSLGPSIELMIEIYFRDNPTAVARARGDVTDFGSDVHNSPTVLRMTLHRGDLCRLIEDKALLRLAFRIGHEDFHRSSSGQTSGPSASVEEEEEVRAVEESWTEIGKILLDQCRWRRTLEGMSVGRGYYAKLTQATSLLSIESIDVTAEVLDRKSAKMRVQKPIMRSQLRAGSGAVSSMMSKEFDLLCDSRAELVLVLPSVLHSQTCQVVSLSERRPTVVLQVMIWQRGVAMGVVCFDWSQKEIYLLQPSPVEQETLCLPLQAAGREEVAINMSLYATSLTYQEEVPPPPLSSHATLLSM
jgi:hypothetical protein